MKLSRTVVLSGLVACAMVVGAATAYAEPQPQGAEPQPQAVEPQPREIDWSQPLLSPTAEGEASQAAEYLFPDNDPKQAAFDNMANEISIGWENGGLPGLAIGANIGSAVGCVSLFPSILVGCVLGTAIGTVAGAVIAIDMGNPNAQAAVEQFFATP
ncbi:hypothetical protein BFN03_00400 [Rhodococcus sp. WMMA185]|uniref:hypothetical protein n=1 Tax=Rhodococcus sp. WMMA185 TaxID=679318 RepID=UPI0008787CCD|nr:hypothetical protein [Rhodococcus sp. WMMA185]AOW94203.1 hypothetical protein BFN03_00400 [Rhodococcus sp. WMMA185]